MFQQLSEFEMNHFQKLKGLLKSLQEKGEWILYEGTSLKKKKRNSTYFFMGCFFIIINGFAWDKIEYAIIAIVIVKEIFLCIAHPVRGLALSRHSDPFSWGKHFRCQNSTSNNQLISKDCYELFL
jgi:hypothetical protein